MSRISPLLLPFSFAQFRWFSGAQPASAVAERLPDHQPHANQSII
jgi:hypothetical protein